MIQRILARVMLLGGIVIVVTQIAAHHPIIPLAAQLTAALSGVTP